MRRIRSWLFAPGHNQQLLGKVFAAGADEVLLDLEDAVPPYHKDRARALVAEAIRTRRCWVRVNRPQTQLCADDLDAVRGLVRGIRLPKVESRTDVEWVAYRVPGVPLDCTIESARGVAAAHEIAQAADSTLLSFGSIDLSRELGIEVGETELLYARSAVVISARAANMPAPSDGVYPLIQDETGLRREAELAKRLGFFGKSAIHPRQVPIINEVFTPTEAQIEWARSVLAAFEASDGAATSLRNGEFIDLPVAMRARDLLDLAESVEPDNDTFAG